MLGSERPWDAPWKQPFVFTEVDCLSFGLFQNKVPELCLSCAVHVLCSLVARWLLWQGGPCGVLATVQAYMMKHLLYGEQHCDINDFEMVQIKAAAVCRAVEPPLSGEATARGCAVRCAERDIVEGGRLQSCDRLVSFE